MHTQVPKSAYIIPTEFDPNLALAIVWAPNLDELKKRGHQFLDELVLNGHNNSSESMQNNIAFLKEKTDYILQF